MTNTKAGSPHRKPQPQRGGAPLHQLFAMLLFLFERTIQFLFASYLATSEIPRLPDGPGAIGPEATLWIDNRDVQPDGFSRSASLINGVFPAPVIVGNKGDTFKLNVVNMLSDATMHRSTSIHWHGVTQRGSLWADGAIGVSQCPIPPGNSFLYEFPAPRAGTFWYHSHYASQYCDGMRGALIVYDPNDPHKALYDEDNVNTVLTLGEWYHYPSPSLDHFPSSDSTLFNGKGRDPLNPTADLYVLNVEFGKRYRLRLVSISCDPSFMFSIDGHRLTVIEADGELVEPVPKISRLEIFAGQRYSVILTANQPIGNYWIRSKPSAGNNGLPDTFENGVNSAILRYRNADYALPTTHHTLGTVLLEQQLHALIDPAAPGEPKIDGADVNHNFALTYDDDTEMFAINGSPFVANVTVPILLQILNNVPAEKLLPSGSIYKLPRNKSISISMPGGVFDGPHPFHLHGHSFSVVRSADSDDYNFENPVRRDVTSFGDEGSNVTIRFRTDNPGPWIFHCHIDWHLVRGMAIVFVEDNDTIPKDMPPPQEWNQTCEAFKALPPSMTEIITLPIPTPTEGVMDADSSNQK